MKKSKEIDEIDYDIIYICPNNPNKDVHNSINKSDILYSGMFGWNEGYYDEIDEAYIDIKCVVCGKFHKIYFKK